MFCDKCGASVKSTQVFCSECGRSLPKVQPKTSDYVSQGPASRTAMSPTALVTLLLGFALFIVAVVSLHPFSAFLATIAILIVGFGLFYKGLQPRQKLIGAGVALLLVLVSNTVEGMQIRRDEQAAAAHQKQLEAEKAERDRKAQESFNNLSASDHLAAARVALKVDAPKPKIDEGLRHLAAIKADTPEGKQAVAVRQQFEQAQTKRNAEIAKQRAVEAKQKAVTDALAAKLVRDAMAKSVEDKLLSEGYNVDVNAIGKDHTTMRIKWILVSKVLAHQLTEDGAFLNNCREAGFKRVEITDGYDETWYWNFK